MALKIQSLKKDKKLKYHFDYTKDDDRLKKIIQEAHDDTTNTTFQQEHEFPSPEFFQEFSQMVYKSERKNFGDWLLLFAAEGKVMKVLSGFYAELYYNNLKRQLIVVIRGSATIGNWVKTDLVNVLLKWDGGEIDSVFTFGEKVRQLVAKFKSHVQLFITGHSLGGYLAQVATYTIKNLVLKGDSAFKNSDPNGIHPHTIVFDSPPCFDRIKKIAQENPVTVETLRLDITNYVVDRNAINSYSKLGSHLGTVISLRDKNELRSPSLWSLLKNVCLHGIANFKEIDEEKICRIVDISRAEAVPFEMKILPWFTFSVQEIEYLKAVPFLMLTDRKLFEEIPNFKFKNGNIELKTPTRSQFIPKVRYFLTKYEQKFTSAVSEVQNHFNLMMKEAWKLLNQESSKIEFKLANSLVERIKNSSGITYIIGLKRMEEKMLLAKLMHNSINNLFFIHQSIFVKIDQHQRDNWLRAFKGMLVLILEEEEEAVTFESYKTKVILIAGEGLQTLEAEKTLIFENVIMTNLNEESKLALLSHQIDFFGNKIAASQVFDCVLSEIPLIDVLKFSATIPEPNKSMWDTNFFIEQDISNNIETYSTIQKFTKFILESDDSAFLISSNAGMGKSTYLRAIRKCLQKILIDHWVVRLELNTCHNEFYEVKNGQTDLNTVSDALSLLCKKVEPSDTIKQTVLDIKLVSKRAIILLDAFDEVCPYYREVAKIFIQLIHKAGMIMVITSRPQEEQEILSCLENEKEWNVFRLEQLTEPQQIEYLTLYWSHVNDSPLIALMQPDLSNYWFERSEGVFVPKYLQDFRREAENILLELRRQFTGREELWGIPLQLRMVAEAFPSGKLTEGFRKHSDLFKLFIAQRIELALVDKFRYDLKQAKQRGDLDRKERDWRLILYKLAIASIFHEGQCKKVDESEINDMHTLGLATVLEVKMGHEVTFLHRTFAEYLCAECFVAKIYDFAEAKKVIAPIDKFGDIMLQGEFVLMRRFMNTIIAHSPYTNSTKAVNLYSQAPIRANCHQLLWNMIVDNLLNLYKMFTELNVQFDLNKCDQNGRSVLGVLKLAFGISKNEDNDGYAEYPLYWAIKSASADFVNLLVNGGADITKVDCSTKQHFVLHWAVQKGVNQLIINNFDHMGFMIDIPDYDRKLPIHYAVMAENLELIAFLIEKGSDCNFGDHNRKTPLIRAIETGNLEVVILVCASRSIKLNAPGWKGFTPLQTAVFWKKYYVIEYLLSLLPKINLEVKSSHGTALMLAVYEGDEEIVKLLLQNGAKAEACGRNCLHVAAKRGHVHLLRLFLKILLIDSQDELDRTPLYLAVDSKHLPAIEFLLEKGADPNIMSFYMMTSLHLAVSSPAPSFEIIQRLVSSNKCDFSIKDEQGMTALHLACIEGHADVMGLLITKGADPYEMDRSGLTPLQLAEKCGNQSAIRMIQQVLTLKRLHF